MWLLWNRHFPKGPLLFPSLLVPNWFTSAYSQTSAVLLPVLYQLNLEIMDIHIASSSFVTRHIVKYIMPPKTKKYRINWYSLRCTVVKTLWWSTWFTGRDFSAMIDEGPSLDIIVYLQRWLVDRPNAFLEMILRYCTQYIQYCHRMYIRPTNFQFAQITRASPFRNICTRRHNNSGTNLSLVREEAVLEQQNIIALWYPCSTIFLFNLQPFQSRSYASWQINLTLIHLTLIWILKFWNENEKPFRDNRYFSAKYTIEQHDWATRCQYCGYFHLRNARTICTTWHQGLSNFVFFNSGTLRLFVRKKPFLR
jgi:hypothetical protein